MQRLTFIGFLLISFLFLSCGNPKSIVENEATTSANSQESVLEDGIVFFFLNISGEEGKRQVDLQFIRSVEGKTKPTIPNPRKNNYSIIIQFFDEADELLTDMTMNHPLYPVFETHGAENEGMETHTVNLESAEFSFKFQMHPSIAKLNVIEVLNGIRGEESIFEHQFDLKK